ncbi:MAG TPA: transcription factor [Gammaproteobacteria bacterium]|jgi:hypothetical protein|nr:transcription factor [Gammaproteobacteria bacterium]
MFEEIRNEIHKAAAEDQKVAMLHFQVLKNARQLANTDAKEFCGLVGIPETYATEFRKMLGLFRLMEQLGVRLVG